MNTDFRFFCSWCGRPMGNNAECDCRKPMVFVPEPEVEKLRAEIARLRAQADQNDAELGLAQAEAARLRNALESQRALWESLPSGVDYDADSEDTSPHDLVAHTAGLAVREIDKVIGKNDTKP